MKKEIQTAYLNAYNDIQSLIQDLQNKLHDMPAPDSDIKLDWGHVGDMRKIKSELQEILG